MHIFFFILCIQLQIFQTEDSGLLAIEQSTRENIQKLIFL